MELELTGRTAFVSGSTQGIGYAIARGLAREGVDVIVNGRTENKLADAVESLRTEVPGARVDGIATDFSDASAVDRLCETLGDVDILVNNVGLFEVAPFADISDEQWQRYFDVNVMSGVRLSRRLMPSMLEKNWGRILFVSSESGVNVPPEMIHYGSTKAAMLGLANGLAKLTKGTAVTVNSVLGGPTYSDGVSAAVEHIAHEQGIGVQDMKAAVIDGNSTTLLQLFIEPDEIANMVTFLTSPLASATNGSAIRVDGGVLQTTL